MIDDAIEEVKSSVARDKAMEQLAMERQAQQKLHTRRTKKRKHKTPAKDNDDDEELEQDFFRQVDSEMAQQRKQQKIDKKDSTPTGRHTTFLSTEEEMESGPIQTNHNIELVVLGKADEGPSNNALLQSAQDKVGLEPSQVSHLFARGGLTSGKDQAKRKGTKKKIQSNAGWKRSKKMNILAFGRRKVKRRKGRAAANFVVS